MFFDQFDGRLSHTSYSVQCMDLCFMGKKEIEFTGLRDNKMAASLIQDDENKIQEKKTHLEKENDRLNLWRFPK